MQHIQLSGVCGTLRVKHEDDTVSITLDGRPTALVLSRATRVLKLGARSLWGPDSHIASFKASAPTSPEVLYNNASTFTCQSPKTDEFSWTLARGNKKLC